MKDRTREGLNNGTLDVDILSDLILKFVVVFKESILQRFHRKETNIRGKRSPNSC